MTVTSIKVMGIIFGADVLKIRSSEKRKMKKTDEIDTNLFIKTEFD